LVYRDREAAKKQRRGLKPVPEAVITRQPTPGLIAIPSLSTGAFKLFFFGPPSVRAAGRVVSRRCGPSAMAPCCAS